jgi:2-methylisocitrate lyase-like PEP mutase family enzyme
VDSGVSLNSLVRFVFAIHSFIPCWQTTNMVFSATARRVVSWTLASFGLLSSFSSSLSSVPAPPQQQQRHQQPSERLSTLLSQAGESKRALPLIGVYDALSARILQDAYMSGNNNDNDCNDNDVALFVSGFGVSAARLGVPDAGILTRTDLADTIQQISLSLYDTNNSNSNSDPIIIADGDTGFGGTPNVRQTIRQMASLNSVAAISIEDQLFPKRCTYVAGSSVTVTTRDDAVKRIQTALAARDEVYERTGRKVSIIARTDCRMQLGFDEAASRCQAFEALGADIVYAENLQSAEEYATLRGLVQEAPMMLAQVQNVVNNNAGANNKRHHYTLTEIGELGYEMGLMGVTGLQATVAALQKVAAEMVRGDGLLANPEESLASLEDIKEIVGFNDLDAFEEEYNCT